MDSHGALWRKGSCIGIDYEDDGAFTFNVAEDDDPVVVFQQLKSLLEKGHAMHNGQGEDDHA